MNAARSNETKGDQPAWLVVPGMNLPQPCRIRRYDTGRLSIETPSPLRCHHFVEVRIAQQDATTMTIKGMVMRSSEEGAVFASDISFWPPL
ncbi:MAG: hypothetical protein EOM92_04430 [Gammaproteobacteria bacterium]|nr:hypothetical protein [Gammaproteobacteria bacterium]